ncbi:glycosyltransferase family 4 protein [Pseudomonas sp. NPDC087598]|uniref:MraY family glycosyltransferase n=1 Tax=Pseudomonas sp. NPDC087598 TaxID=3364440 RepID=UPI003817CD27
MSFWWFLAAVAASFTMTAVIRRYAITRSLLDIPNARSSHTLPTPRGGGLAIVVVFLIAIGVMSLQSAISLPVLCALLGAGGLVAIIGFMDDHGHIAARWRLFAHFVAAIWVVFWLGGLPQMVIFGHAVNFAWAGSVLAAVYLVWMLNLYNFMDGIDGIASVQAICACLGCSLLYCLGELPHLMWVPLMLAFSVIGFLFWNFPPARIFMGDAGSGFIGIVLGGLSLQAAHADQRWFWVWLILLGVFIVDATFTLLRRLMRGDKVYEAHRSHAYQYASRRYGRHLPVTLGVLFINVCWLLPLAASVIYMDIDGASATLIAYIPLLAIAIKYHAGASEAPFQGA